MNRVIFHPLKFSCRKTNSSTSSGSRLWLSELQYFCQRKIRYSEFYRTTRRTAEVDTSEQSNVPQCLFHAVDGARRAGLKWAPWIPRRPSTAPCRPRRVSTRLKAPIETYGYLKARRRAVDGGPAKALPGERGRMNFYVCRWAFVRSHKLQYILLPEENLLLWIL